VDVSTSELDGVMVLLENRSPFSTANLTISRSEMPFLTQFYCSGETQSNANSAAQNQQAENPKNLLQPEEIK